MSPSYWGPSTWQFMHTLASKVKEDSFPAVGQKLIEIMVQISCHLPCPECRTHAKQFWSNVKQAQIRTKQDLVNLLFVFHNMVNKRKKLPAFKHDQLSQYNSKNVVQVYNEFARNFNTRGNMNMLNDAFHRDMMMSSLRNWVIYNVGAHFER